MSETEIVMQREQGVASLGGGAGALSKCLESPPAGSKDFDVKDMNAKIVYSVIQRISDGEIDSAIEKLSMAECDTLMKYIYKSLGDGDSELSGLMLKWHSKVAAKAGQGCIVRTIVDRKTV
ncbi:hypothetical protein ScalyP_jg4900 [Parmales sp. scaly parma]|nr:hypothetical protein ScalyP_jg4900 [Parmales sp. scaly parma]|tara:strand:+ start:274 stop:636 length:363 start_codon:yes stop_codon:yes gene_type:complete